MDNQGPVIPIEAKGWEWHDSCDCDQEFIEYLYDNPLHENTRIFHMGPGMHHKVGLWASNYVVPLFVQSITITPPEMDEYMRLAAADPHLNRHYQVMFGDIHLLEERMLNRYDYISLFHLGEISDQVNNLDYNGSDIRQVIHTFADHLNPHGKMLFFEKSCAWKRIEDDVEEMLHYERRWLYNGYHWLKIYIKEG